MPTPRSLVECFEGLPDPRLDRTRRHNLVDILVIGLCTLLTVGEGFTDMAFVGRTQEAWFRTFLELPNGIPSHDTFNRVFSLIDPARFLECFVTWVREVCPTVAGQSVAIDGKALRRAADSGEPLPHIVSAFATESGLALGQVKTDDKSNEITAVPALLDALALKGAVVTTDAMGCQKEIAARIRERGADYVLALKGNQPLACAEFTDYFEQAVPPGTRGRPAGRDGDARTMEFHQTVEKGHGRLDVRRYWQTTDIGWFHDRALWKGLTSAGLVESERTVKGNTSVQRRLYLSSLALDAAGFAKAVRGHWAVENTLHWSLDVTFNEDQNRARTRHAAHNLATLRRLALNLLKTDKAPKRSLRQKRFLAAMDGDYLKQLLGV